MSQLAGIIEALRSIPDLEHGLCVGQWDLFDTTDDPAAVDQAIELCSQCSVLTRCQDWLASLKPQRRPCGVVAGIVRQP